MAILPPATVAKLLRIGAGTRTIEGTPTSEPCWSWALYGGGAPRDPADLFAIANADNLAQSLEAPQQRDQLFQAAVDHSERAEGLSAAERAWAIRQNTKFRRGGKYTNDYLFEKIVKRAVERAGLTLARGASNYMVCMHAPAVDNITYEHWWLEAHGYTAEKLTLWREPYIYRRGQDPVHYRSVRVPVTGLHQWQVSRIIAIVDGGTDKQTQEWS